MQLHFSQIKAITTGAARVEERENGISFYRFTAQQEELYKNRSADFHKKTLSASGVRLQFRTDSKTLFFKVEVAPGSSRSYFAFDIFVNGRKNDVLDNFSGVHLPKDYTQMALPLGEFSKTVDLGDGQKDVCIYFPWSVSVILKELAVDDHCLVQPIKPKYKLLCLGDSVSQGYDALYPSNKYITRIADMLDAQEYNKAIGGEVFFPQLASTKEDFVPDYIVVAYGTNNWFRTTYEVFANDCTEFFSNLHAAYPDSRIFVITPIWHNQADELRPLGKFECVAKTIQEQVAKYDHMSVIHGFDFVPQDENLFGDLSLHPNDRGFDYYFENLSKRIKELL